MAATRRNERVETMQAGNDVVEYFRIIVRIELNE